jgi:nucleotide-sensitive chloride channel 1A
MEILHTAPVASSFVPLSEHQSHTPESFYSGPPVLHHHSERCKVVILERDLRNAPALNGLRGAVSSASNGAAVNGDGAASTAGENDEDGNGKDVVIDDVDVWVTSEYGFFPGFSFLFLLFYVSYMNQTRTKPL